MRLPLNFVEKIATRSVQCVIDALPNSVRSARLW